MGLTGKTVIITGAARGLGRFMEFARTQKRPKQ